jgi:AcrR family transcriptional regulator
MAESIENPDHAQNSEGTGAADHLCRTALKLFARKGYASTSVNEIVEAAGVTKPMLYYYFGSKERLARRIVVEPAERMAETLESLASSGLSYREQQIAWLRAHFEFCRENPDRARFVFALYFGPLGAELAQSVGAVGKRYKAILYDIVRKREATCHWADSRIDEYVDAMHGQMFSAIITMLYDEERSTTLLKEPADDLARRLIENLDQGYLSDRRE